MIFFPAIDILEGRAVRLAQGSYSDVTTYNPDPVDQARVFADAGAEWIHIVDLDGAKTGKTENHKTIERILSSVDIGIEVGGGIRELETIGKYVEAGARRIVLGTKLATDPEFVERAVEEFGEFLVAGIDARDGRVSISGWTDDQAIMADDLVAKLPEMGISHLVFTDISNDGMQTGIDVDRYLEISKIAGFPVVASGGVAGIEDVRALAAHPEAIEGVISGKAIYEGKLDLEEALKASSGESR
ncbi:MAG: 1-(5-phosphoribosyl)-5-[(5-phosphoribosylamino)methylideneamino]imidazole-4-carboxamide isomerase [Coriobacteriales bacterium]|jgi:phosphoribosylformimino-5-aminoimidazole carboxamide ribotide isomerase